MKLFRLGAAVLLLLSAGCDSKPHVQWTAYTPEVMAAARHSGKPVFADFYAAWCGPCMQMKDHTFTDPRVIEALEPFVRIKVDMSFNRSPEIQKVSDEYEINGLPTTIFFDPQGNPQDHLSGFIGPDQLLETIRKFKERFHIISPAPLPAAS